MKHNSRKTLIFGVLGIFSFLILGYGYAKTRDLLSGTKLVVLEPRTGEVVKSEMITIEGEVGPIIHLEINGAQVLSGEGGRFEYKTLLAPGYNVIEIQAIDKFDREIRKTIEVVYEPQKHTAQNN